MKYKEKREIQAIQIPPGVNPFTIKSSCDNEGCAIIVESGDYLVWADEISDPCAYTEADFNETFGPVTVPDPVTEGTGLMGSGFSQIKTLDSPTFTRSVVGEVVQCGGCGVFMAPGQTHTCWFNHTNNKRSGPFPTATANR